MAASRSTKTFKQELKQVLADTRKLSANLARLIENTSDYDIIRQLKKVDAELLDVQHNLALALEMEEKING
ncbi:MAG: hypothetical protein WBP42_06175 [Candidatus Zixiibacteriota bacterium]